MSQSGKGDTSLFYIKTKQQWIKLDMKKNKWRTDGGQRMSGARVRDGFASETKP